MAYISFLYVDSKKWICFQRHSTKATGKCIFQTENKYEASQGFKRKQEVEW